MKYIFAGDRDISVWVLGFLMDQGYSPSALLLSDANQSTHAEQLIQISKLPPENVIFGKAVNSPKNIEKIKEIKPDYVFGVHFPYIISKKLLDVPKVGFLNLHPAYLPYNKGWHTPSWAILDKTPIGATLHFMSEKLDEGEIIHQKKLTILPCDTAHSLYARIKKLGLEVFKEALPALVSLHPPRKTQKETAGSCHFKKDLFAEETQQIFLDKQYLGGELIDKLRALTTNNPDEAAYFVFDGAKYRVQVQIQEADSTKNKK